MKAVESWWTFPGFTVELVATGLHKPVNVVHVPRPNSGDDDAKLYVSELYGRIVAISNDCQVHTYAEGLLNYRPDFIFPGSGESGVTGLCIEPRSGDLFASMLYAADGKHKAKVVRFHSDDGLRATSQTTVVDDIPSVLGAHQVQAVTVGPDGKLYVNTGDGMVDPAVAQDDADLRGKILRYELDGTIPSDNPDPHGPVYAKGLRCPFGAAWRNDGSLYVTDNGPEDNDRICRVEPGGNYGWPDDLRTNALFWWQFTQAPTALAFMDGGQFPAAFDDHLFVCLAGPARYKWPSMKGKRIVKMQLNPDGPGVLSYDDFVVYMGEGMGMPVGLTFGPDGLYFTDLHGEGDIYGQRPGGNVLRVRPEG